MKTQPTLRHIVAALLCSQCISSATLLTDESQLSLGNTFIDFELLSPGEVSNPLVIGDATFSSPLLLSIEDVTSYNPPGAVSHYVLRANGGGIYDTPYVNIRIDFATAISEIGFGWWDSNFEGNQLLAYNASDVLLESAPIPPGGTGGGYAVFRGISRPSNDISYVVASIAAGTELYGIDKISYGSVPEPFCAILMMGSALVLLRRNRNPRNKF